MGAFTEVCILYLRHGRLGQNAPNMAPTKHRDIGRLAERKDISLPAAASRLTLKDKQTTLKRRRHNDIRLHCPSLPLYHGIMFTHILLYTSLRRPIQ